MKKKTIIIAAIVIFLLIVGLDSMYTVRENEYACVFRFSQIVETKNDAGLHFKLPFVDSVKTFPRTTMIYDIPPSEVLTSDKQNMIVDCYVLWSISEPQQFYRAVGTTTEAEARLNAITYEALKTAMGTLSQSQIVNMNDGAERNEIYDSIAAVVNQEAVGYGILVEDVKIKQFDVPAANLSAVYARMISERNQKAAAHTANGNKEATEIKNETDKTVKITLSNAQAQAAKLVAEGEAEYMRILAEAFNTQDKQEFYEFTLALDALEQSLTGENKTVILDKDSELAKILTGNS